MSFKNLRKFFRKSYRDIFGTSITGTTAAQIRAMREKKGWSQEELAEEAEMGQARISLLENPNYQNLSLNTLKRIANVFDVALVVRFEPFGRLFAIIDNETSSTLAVPSFVEEFGTDANPITTSARKVVVLAERLAERLNKLQQAAPARQPKKQNRRESLGTAIQLELDLAARYQPSGASATLTPIPVGAVLETIQSQPQGAKILLFSIQPKASGEPQRMPLQSGVGQ